MNKILSKNGKLLTRTDKENLMLFRFEENSQSKDKDYCKQEYRTSASFTDEINEYIPERKGYKYYWGLSRDQTLEDIANTAKWRCSKLVISKIPKENVSIGNFSITNEIVNSEEDKSSKQKIAENYNLMSYTKFEKMKPKDRVIKFGDSEIEFLVKQKR